MKVDIVAEITDDLAQVGKDQDSNDHLVSELTPQAKLLAQMAQEAALKPIEGDWDIKPHPLLSPAAPTREQFDAEETAPVVLMRNPIAGKQVGSKLGSSLVRRMQHALFYAHMIHRSLCHGWYRATSCSDGVSRPNASLAPGRVGCAS